MFCILLYPVPTILLYPIVEATAADTDLVGYVCFTEVCLEVQVLCLLLLIKFHV